MSPELKNYLAWCSSARSAAGALKSVVFRAALAVCRRAMPNYMVFVLPKGVRSARQQLIRGYHRDTKDYDSNELVLKGYRLQVLNQSLVVHHKHDWWQDFDDAEEKNSLHRWGWLFQGQTSSGGVPILRAHALVLMRSWLDVCSKDTSLNEDSYSSSERIVNGSLFLLSTGDGEVPSDLQAAMRQMGRNIAEKLEYHEESLTGNHAFNNGRGLLFSGLVSGLPFAVDLAFEIFKDRLPRLVTDDGFMREGSSHYHFLFTRWVLEVYWLADRFNESSIANFVKPYAERLLKKCWFFLVWDSSDERWEYPLIGDISPDSTPDWLLSLPWSRLALKLYRPTTLPRYKGPIGWASLFGLETSTADPMTMATQTYANSYWHRIEHDDLTLFIHAAASDGKLETSHRHLDLGGFVLYRGGSPVVIDCGRKDYQNSKDGLYGWSATSHNTLCINELSAEVDGPTWLNPDYRRVKVATKIIKKDCSTYFVLSHNGFKRLSSHEIWHKREFILNDDGVVVRDTIDGDGINHLRFMFHFHSDLGEPAEYETHFVFSNKDVCFGVDSRLTRRYNVSSPSAYPLGTCWDAYDRPKGCFSLITEDDLELPVILQHTIAIKS